MTKLLVLAFIVIPVLANAQNWSPAFDSNVYFPDLENPDEIQTLVSTEENPFTIIVKTIPSSQVSPYGQLLFGGPPNQPPFLNIVKGGPEFSTWRIKNAQKLDLPQEAEYFFGHFRGPMYTDLLCRWYLFPGYRIYWSDDQGNYSVNRYSTLLNPVDTGGAIGFWPDQNAYITDLNEDGLDDILFMAQHREFIPNRPEDTYVYQFTSDNSWREKDSIEPTDFIMVSPHDEGSFSRRFFIPGDFRGTGQKDLVVRDENANLLFFPLSFPFALEAFKLAIIHDTVWTVWENPALRDAKHIGGNIQAVDAIPDPNGAEELMFFYYTSDQRNRSMFLFKGGEAFGRSRLYLDNSDFVLYPPSFYDDRFEGLPIGQAYPVGDISGSNNGSVFRIATELTTTYYLFYVLGEALDDKVDMAFYTDNNGSAGGTADSITANNDKYTDVAIAHNTYERGKGGMHIVYGSPRIPVTLSPKFSKISLTNDLEASVYPNPFRETFNIQMTKSEASGLVVTLRDILGRQVFIGSGIQDRDVIELSPEIPPGYYILQVRTASQSIDIPIVKQ